MFLYLSVILFTGEGACVVGAHAWCGVGVMHARGHVWWGVHGRGVCGRRACIGGVHGRGGVYMEAYMGGMCGRGRHVWQRMACIAGVMHGRGMHGRGGVYMVGACMAGAFVAGGGMCGRGGHAWQGTCMAEGHVWQGVCVAGACMAHIAHPPPLADTTR